MKISVVIPVYNAGQYLKKCLDSVIAQSYSLWEIIAINDGSKDSSWEVLRQYSEKDNRIKTETKDNEGPGITRNRALDKASGDIIVFLDADDYIEPNYFELLVKTMIEKNADVVFIDVIQESLDGKIIKHERMSKFSKYDKKTIIGCQMTGYLPWGAWRKAVLRSLITEKQLHFTDSPGGEEAIFSFELLRHAKNVCFIKKSLYHYINRPNSQSKVSFNSPTLEKMKQHLDEYGMRDEYADSLNAFAFTKLILWVFYEAKRATFKTCLKELRNKVGDFENEYGWNIGRRYLRLEARLLLPVIRLRILAPVVLAAKFVKR